MRGKRFNNWYKVDSRYKQVERRIVVVESDWLTSCWRFTEWYPRVNGLWLHKEWARGEGEIVRHLCSDGKCVNPLHLKRGDDIENAMDEVNVMKFSASYWSILLDEDYSSYGDQVAYLVLRARASRFIDKNAGRTMKQINSDAREMFRKSYIAVIREKVIDSKTIDYITDKFKWLNSRNDLEICIIKEEK